MTSRLARIAAPILGLSLTSCMMGPNYKRPVVTTPPSYRGAPEAQVTGDSANPPIGAQKWNTVFTDPILQDLINLALKNNYDVKIAADRVLEEQAQVGITKSALLPSLTAGGSYAAIGVPSGALGGSNTRDKFYGGGLTSSAAWNLDFWGMYRRQTEAARAQLRATEWAAQVTYSTLVESVASSYYTLRGLDAQIAIVQQTVDARKQTLDLTTTLESGGSGTLADVRQAEQLYFGAKAQIPELARQIEQQENNLRLLLGQPPGPIARGVSISDISHPTAVPVGLPSELLERRPDVRRAEELLVQANANIGVARAAFFPQISISALGGIASSQLNGLVNAKNGYFYATGSVSQSVFDGGKLRNNYRLAKASNQELLDTYQQTIAGALRDVSNALVAYAKSRDFREQQERETTSAADAVRLARMRYEAGSTSFLEVLTTDSNLFSAELSLEAAQQEEALSLVQLYNALGGGW